MTTTPDPEQMAAALARFHRSDPPDDFRSYPLASVGELSRVQGWTLRSALVRYAQPEPVRASAVLHLVRQVETALHPLAKTLDAVSRPADRALSPASFVPQSNDDRGDHRLVFEPIEPVLDHSATDLARCAVRCPEQFPDIVDAYRRHVDLSDDEVGAIGPLSIAVLIDSLADTLVAWACDPSNLPRPDLEVDQTCREASQIAKRLAME